MSSYLTEVTYPARFHRETSPRWLHAVGTALGRAVPDPDQTLSWCELGCGEGLNATLLAAANPHIRFVGVDLNAEHIAIGQRRAQAAGLDNVVFIHADFAHFADRSVPHEQALAKVPGSFDIIVCHGVWSWVDQAARDALLRVAAGRLAIGGVFYLGYMSHPGASPMAHLQRLLLRRAQRLPGNASQRATASLAWLRQLAAAGLGSLAEHPGLHRQLDAMAGEHPAQIAHEFLTPHWQPDHAADVIDQLAAVGLDYIGSATPLENIDAISLPGDAQPLIAAIDDVGLRESAKDAARNQSLRRDLFQRTAPALTPGQHRAALDAIRFAALPGAARDGGLTLDTRIGPVPAPAELFGPCLRALAAGPKSFAELAALPAYAGQVGALNIVLQTLLWAGCSHPWRNVVAHAGCRRLDATLSSEPDPALSRRWQAHAGYGSALTIASQ